MIENFVGAVLEKTPLLSDGASSLWTDWVIEQARKDQGSSLRSE
jgi:hypothetical protein